MRYHKAAWLLLLPFLICAHEANADESVPFRTRNLNPLVAIFGMPVWRAPRKSLEFGLTSELANHYRLPLGAPDTLLLDGETWRTGFFVSKALGERWVIGADIATYHLSGGVLDDLIDGWHSAFHLPDGGRNLRPEDRLEFRLADQAGVFFELASPTTGLGDLELSVGRWLGGNRGFFVNGSIKLPTGDEDMLAGSGSADFSLSLLRTRQVRLRKHDAGYFWGFGFASLGEADRVRYAQRSSVYTGVVGGGLRLSRRFGLKAQIDMHEAIYDSPLEEIGARAFQATFGGSWDLSERGLIEFGVNEDLAVSTSPDVVLHLKVLWQW